MPKIIKYTIFTTNWGFFGLAGTEKALVRSCLPASSREKVKSYLLKNTDTANFDTGIFKTLQEQITAYFEGAYVNFNPDISFAIDSFSLFARQVLTVCRDIPFGQTTCYSSLAKKAGRPAAARAVGRVLAKNPLPLIIPCHRVICADGRIGGFSSPCGVNCKNRMLELEQQVICH